MIHRENASLGYMLASTNKMEIKASPEQMIIARSLITLAKNEQYEKFLKMTPKIIHS
jgi:hypothetical protein